jgi:hypothetical protein
VRIILTNNSARFAARVSGAGLVMWRKNSSGSRFQRPEFFQEALEGVAARAGGRSRLRGRNRQRCMET